ncbi:MAG: radical SAM protein [Alphaproteobacteria bacterium]|nr:radical SAM protein [Alphaproteobacteria bacterium]
MNKPVSQASPLFIDGTKLMHHTERLAAWARGEAIFPIHLDISPAGACNHRCTFCIVDYKPERKGFLDGDVMIKLLRDAAACGVKSILFAGDGEPLLNRRLPDAIEAGAQAGMSMALNTNGVHLKRETMTRVLPHLEWMRVSVAAGTAETYSAIHKTKPGDFDTVFQNIADASAFKRRHGLACTIGIQQILLEENKHEIVALAQKAKDAGASYFTVKRFAEQNMNDFSIRPQIHLECEEQFRKAESLATDDFQVIIRRNNFDDDGSRSYDRCLGLPFLAYVLADGRIYTCCGFYGEPDFSYGSLYENSFAEIWTGKLKNDVIERIETSLDVHSCMKHCRHHNINKLLWSLKNPPRHVDFI